jgi:ribosomal protein S18 acetylase RimI-like enzyme
VAGVSQPASGAAVVVRLGNAVDAEMAARLHAGLITEGFLSALGPRFLRRLYRRVALSEDSFLLVAEGPDPVGDGSGIGGGSAAGFLAGALDLGALYRRFVLHDGVAAAVGSLPELLRSWRRAWETLRHGTSGGGDEDAGPRLAELLSIAVDPAWQGRQVGTLLVQGFLDELARRGAGGAQVVVGADNGPAIALYRRCGFVPGQSFELHRGTVSLLMRRPVGAGPQDMGPGAQPDGAGSA